MVAVDLAENIMNMGKILELELQEVINFLVIKKQQSDLDWYTSAKPNLEHKKTIK